MMIEDRVLWYDGLFIRPEHFEQERHFHESLLHTHLASTPFSYGVIELEIDHAKLKTGVFALNKFCGVFESKMTGSRQIDVMIASVDESLTRNIEEKYLAPRIDVYLGIPGDKNQRFVEHDVEVVKDKNKVKTLKPNVKILFGNEGENDYERLKIAEIKQISSRDFGLNEDYIPPCLHLSVSPRLVFILGEVIGLIVDALNELASQCPSRSDQLYDLNAGDRDMLWFLSTLNRALPMLNHFYNHRENIHPERLFLYLSQFAGELCTFSKKFRAASNLPNYEHDDLSNSFSELSNVIKQLLSLVKPSSRYIEIELERDKVDQNIRLANLAKALPKWVGNPAAFRFCLAIQTNDSKQIEDFKKSVKISSSSQINGIIQLLSKHIDIYPAHYSQLLTDLTFSYFWLEQEESVRQYWEQVEKEGLAIYIPPIFSELPIKLIALRVQD